VALGHHADDQVETFFLRLFRGAGGEGLAGMRTVAPSPAGAGVRLWRPFLGLARRELLEFARARGLRWVEDASNDDRTILRNRLRTELLPLLREQYQPGLDATVRRAMEITGGETECVGEIAQAWLRSRGEAVRGSLPVPAWVVALEAALGSVPFARLPVPVQRRILAGQLAALGLAPNFTWIEALLSPSCPPVTVAPGLRLRRTARGRLVAVPTQAPGFCRAREEVRLTGARGSVEFGGFRFRWRVERARGAPWPLPRRAGREYFDAAETGAGLTLRHWAPGDRFQPLGLGAAAKLQDLFVNAHVPAAERHRRVLAATADGRIVWVQGLRIGEAFKVRPETRQRLEWRWRRAPAAAAASSTPGAGGICGTQGRPRC
jgi:tRNA(Ile)-lysidine synthase